MAGPVLTTAAAISRSKTIRRPIAFDCAGETLLGTLDEAPGMTGLLIVSGGNEIRAGAHRGMALLAAQVARAGIPVFRFDRRGVGDSTGINRGFADSAEDIAAAAAAFRAAAPHVMHLVGFGNCDAATALALFHQDAGIGQLLLANPWVVASSDDMPPAAAIRARYAERLRDPRQWLRLLTGRIDIRKAYRGLTKVAAEPSEENTLAARVTKALQANAANVTILLAKRDATAQAFLAATPAHLGVYLLVSETGSHSFAGAENQQWLLEHMLEALEA